MRIRTACLAASVLLVCGCGKSRTDPKAAVQAAIEAHLQQQKNVVLANMTLEVGDVEVTGDAAQAEVKFRSKQSPDLAVSVHYSLKRAGDRWQVESSSPAGGMGVNPHSGNATPGPAPPAAPAQTPLQSSH